MELSYYNKWFSVSYDDFIKQNKIDGKRINADVRYEKITGATRVDVSDGEFFFFKDGALRLIYISNDDVAEKLWISFTNAIDANRPEKTLRSRAGKTSNQLIFASHGLTASLKGDSVDFVEIYPPCSLQKYLDEVYRDPGLFIR